MVDEDKTVNTNEVVSTSDNNGEPEKCTSSAQEAKKITALLETIENKLEVSLSPQKKARRWNLYPTFFAKVVKQTH